MPIRAAQVESTPNTRHQRCLTAFNAWSIDRNEPFLSERTDREEVLKPGNNMPAKVEEELGQSRVLVLSMSATASGG